MLLTGSVLEEPPQDLTRPVRRAVLSRVMQNVYGRMAVASVAALLALTIWRSGNMGLLLARNSALETYRPEEIAPPAADTVPKSNFTGPEPGVTQKAYKAVTGLWNSLTGEGN